MSDGLVSGPCLSYKTQLLLFTPGSSFPFLPLHLPCTPPLLPSSHLTPSTCLLPLSTATPDSANIFTFTLGCAFTPNTTTLIALCFPDTSTHTAAGLGGGMPVSISGARISVLFTPAKHTTTMSISLYHAPPPGPTVGPIPGFRYIFILLATLAGFCTLVGIPFLCMRKASTLRSTSHLAIQGYTTVDAG
ncbi:hypothetical protein K439DRAFT_1617136 [Ramaria rubella]|nr:hypothetical protein K439DRAFT_1617136 [Ramaria rubella]